MLDRIYVTGDNGSLNFLVFAPILNALILNSIKKVTKWIPTGIPCEKIKPFNTILEQAMSNLANGRVILKFDNSFLVQESSSSLYSNFILRLCTVYDLNN